jgi:hypothetical protein
VFRVVSCPPSRVPPQANLILVKRKGEKPHLAHKWETRIRRLSPNISNHSALLQSGPPPCCALQDQNSAAGLSSLPSLTAVIAVCAVIDAVARTRLPAIDPDEFVSRSAAFEQRIGDLGVCWRGPAVPIGFARVRGLDVAVAVSLPGD